MNFFVKGPQVYTNHLSRGQNMRGLMDLNLFLLLNADYKIVNTVQYALRKKLYGSQKKN